MQSRFLKQFIYGVFYLAVIAGIIWLGFAAVTDGGSCFDNRKNGSETGIDCGGSCPSCELKNLKPIESPRITTFDLGGGRVSGLIEFKNPNVRYGADPFTYAILFFNGSGAPIGTTTRQSFIYPGEVKFTVVADVEAEALFTRAAVVTADPIWKEGESFIRPQVVTRGIEVVLRATEGEAVVSGFVSNESPARLREVVVNVAILGSAGTPVAASRTLVTGLDSQEERFFSVVIPAVSLDTISRDSIRISIEAR